MVKPLIERIINDCEQALKNNLHFAALSLALMLPDICGKAEYPDKKVGDRYVCWYDEHIGKYDKCPDKSLDRDMPYASGKIIYSLRCSMLHQGNPNIDEEKTQIDIFNIIVESYDESGAESCESFGVDTENREDGVITRRHITLNLITLCRRICSVAKFYYKNNSEKFDFFDYHLIDGDELKNQVSRRI